MVAWQARHDLDDQTYQATFTTLVRQGYRLTDVCGYTDGRTVRYTGIWEQRAGPAWEARHGIPAANYQAIFDQLKARGYRPIRLSGYATPTGTQFAGIWIAGPAPAWAARHGLGAADFQTEFNRHRDAGYRLIDITGYDDQGEARYAGIWEKSSGPDWQARHGLPDAAYQPEFDALARDGFVPAKVVGFAVRGAVLYAGIWTRRPTRAWYARHGVDGAAYQRAFDDQRYQGAQLVQVSGYATPHGVRFAGVWESSHYTAAALAEADRLAGAFMTQYNVPGLSLAVSFEGRLIYARARGLADQTAQTPLEIRHRMRIASVAKPITAVATLRLVQAGQLALTDRVFGQGARLGTTYGTSAYDANERAITVEHLLTHTAGFRNMPNDPMFNELTRSHASLIGWVLDNRAPAATPGTTYDYSNFGYCVLGRVIEQVSGQSYASYVQSAVLGPAGASSLAIAGDTLAARAADEVVYTGQSGEDPYTMKVARMDAHGGWIANVIDLLRFLRAIEGRGGVPALLDAASITRMTTGSAARSTYGLGWALDGTGAWDHNGALPGTLSMLRRRADLVGQAALMNTRQPGMAQNTMLAALYTLMDDISAQLAPRPSWDLFN